MDNLKEAETGLTSRKSVFLNKKGFWISKNTGWFLLIVTLNVGGWIILILNDKPWQLMKVKIWNRLLNLPTNPPTKFDDLWILMVLYERAKIFKFCKCGFIATLKIILKAYEDLWLSMKAFLSRRGWDSNPRCPCRHASFQD